MSHSQPQVLSTTHQNKSDNDHNAESMHMLAQIYPDMKEDQHREFLQDTLEDVSPEAAVIYFRELLEVTTSGVAFAATVPPANRTDLKSFDFDIHRIFYHSTWPPHLQDRNAFTWNFYIGKRGQGIESIVQDAHKVYDVKILGMLGEWVGCYLMNVPPRTRVRLLGSASQVHELVFPPDPNESAVVHFLPA
ncbi:hypothetical protein C8R45DRAFT_311844 [Mycena sanguinolenta]|nr:hypothetical protein C8R45DRAFT_311844 [Mycena sanguinolenta]